MKDKRNRIIVGITAICILAIIIGIAYAYIAYYARQKEVNVIGTDCIKLEFKEKTNAINLSKAYPMSDEDGNNTNPYIFEITNVCSVGVNYNINLEVLTKQGVDKTQIPNLLESKNVATKIDNNASKQLTNDIKNENVTYNEEDYTATESYNLYRGVLNPGETKSHELRLWLHYSAGNETQNKNFYSKVVIEGIQNEIASINFSEFIMGKSEVEEITHEATEQTPALTDYRYTGSNPNNYVYFGCDTNCTEDNLYRIIGVIPTQSSDTSPYKNRVKLIKANYYTETSSGLLKETNSQWPAPGGKGYQWNSSANNKWEESTLQNQVLNGVYWNSLGEYQNYIEQAKWYLGAADYNNVQVYTPNQFYNAERSSTQGYSKGATSYINNIGLMYPSDFGYSIENEYNKESVSFNQENYKNNAWLYQLESKYYEWTMTPESSHSYVNAWHLYPAGHVDRSNVYDSRYLWGIRPTFYLSEDVIYVDGTGTDKDPYRIGKNDKRFSDYIIGERTKDTSIVQVVHEATEQTKLDAAVDYRYVGKNPNNYVCFGSETTPCPSDNLYRIIGVMPTQSTTDGEYESRVKLIKATNWEGTTAESGSSYTKTGKGYRWNTTSSNKWEESSLQKTLNAEYWNSLGNYQSYIEQTKWHLGAPNYNNEQTYTPEQFYTFERSNTQSYSKGVTSFIGNIGLMYPSDYGYSIDGSTNEEVWKSQALYNNREFYKSNSWLNQLENKYSEWTISPETDYFNAKYGSAAFRVNADGSVGIYGVFYSTDILGIRPTFYLKSDVLYSKGDGSISNPYRIGL